MGGFRVTQGMLADRTLNSLNAQLLRLMSLQEKLATGLRVNRPSDDPIDARRAISIQTSIRKSEQFIANIQDVEPQLNATESAVTNVLRILQRIQELTLRAANETMNINQMQQSALEVDELLEQVLLETNTRANGKAIFSGTRTLSDAFTATRVAGQITGTTFAGNTDQIEIAFSNSGRTVVNVTGDAAFTNNIDVFQLLIDIRDNMNAGDNTSLSQLRLDELQVALDQTLNSLAQVGTFQNRLERVGNTTQDLVLGFQKQLSDKIDADFAETVLQFNVQQNAFQSALNVSAQIVQVSLLDFIR